VTPSLKHIGHVLTKRYSSAMQVVVPSTAKSLPPSSDGKKIGDKELVYTEGSPTYCEKENLFGSIGTQGRRCDRTPGSVQNCDIMCCNRGYRRKIVTYTEDCNCKFVWCCELKCQKCTHVEEHYYCK